MNLECAIPTITKVLGILESNISTITKVLENRGSCFYNFGIGKPSSQRYKSLKYVKERVDKYDP